ncbi:hypothetical protein M514_22548 [Trichuris suis]|uniref:Uncharacterized protein n=1 Tax=Trichuris suis TaxID=68888 RepID=A0A085N724_9BILA|nr:hypothetical protein M514_22548 [Trichuris suis]
MKSCLLRPVEPQFAHNRQAIQWSPFDKQALSQEDNATGAVDEYMFNWSWSHFLCAAHMTRRSFRA